MVYSRKKQQAGEGVGRYGIDMVVEDMEFPGSRSIEEIASGIY